MPGRSALLKHGGNENGKWFQTSALPRVGRLGFPFFLAVADADEFGFFFLLGLLEERSETFGTEAEFLLHAGVRIVGIVEFLEQEQEIELSTGELDFGIVVNDELRIGASGTQGTHGVDLILLGQGLVEVEDPRIELIVDADDLLAGFEHGKR